MVRRRIRITRSSAWAIAGVGALSAVVAAFAGARPVPDAWAAVLLTGLVAAAVPWAAASAPWWAVPVAGALCAVAAGSWVWFVLSLVATVAALALASQRAALPVVRAVLAAVVVQAALRLDVDAFFGAPSIVAAVALGVVFVSGVARRKREVRRRVWWAAAGAAAVAVAGTAGLGIAAATSVGDLRAANAAARASFDLLDSGDSLAAAERLAAADAALGRVRSRVGAPWAQVARLVPVVAQHRAAAADLAGSGRAAAAAAATALGAVDLETLAFEAGRIDLDAVVALRQPLAGVAAAMAELDRSVAALPRSPWLVAPLQGRLAALSGDVTRASVQAGDAARAIEVAPAMLGAERPRRYFLAFTTPAEARGLGGFMGNYGVLTADRGRLSLTEFGRTLDLNRGGDPANRVISGPADFLARYGPYGAGGEGTPARPDVWSIVTMPPDMPTVGQVVAELYPQSGGTSLDGVVAIDPAGLAALLRLTGPIVVADRNLRLDADNAVEFLVRGQYEGGADTERVEALEEVARLTIDRLLGGSIPSPTAVARLLGPPSRAGHLVAWFADPAEQAVARRARVDGSLPRLAGRDGLAVVTNNGGANKLDAFLRRSVAYDLSIDAASGQADGRVRVTLTNEAPTSGLPDGVIGNYLGDPVGANRSVLSLYSALPVVGVTIGGEPVRAIYETELGWNVATVVALVGSGEELAVEFTVQGVVADPATYELLVRPQPLVHADALAINVASTSGRTYLSWNRPLTEATLFTRR